MALGSYNVRDNMTFEGYLKGGIHYVNMKKIEAVEQQFSSAFSILHCCFSAMFVVVGPF